MSDWREEETAVKAALDKILPTLKHPYLATPLGFLISKETGIEEKRCRTIMGWAAKKKHPHATHDGGTVKSYGREVMRWRWHPTPQHGETPVVLNIKAATSAIPHALIETYERLMAMSAGEGDADGEVFEPEVSLSEVQAAIALMRQRGERSGLVITATVDGGCVFVDCRDPLA